MSILVPIFKNKEIFVLIAKGLRLWPYYEALREMGQASLEENNKRH